MSETTHPIASRCNAKYHWPKWFARKSFTLVRGEDYLCMSHGMAQAIRNAAGSERYRLSISLKILESPERIEVTVNGPAQPRKGRKKPCRKQERFPRTK